MTSKIEKLLYAIASISVSIILYTTWIGFKKGGREANPIARKIFETFYFVFGSWKAAVLIFIPIVFLGLYAAVKLINRDYKTKFPKAGQVFLSAFILLILPNVVNNLFGFLWTNSFISLSGVGLAGLYLIFCLIYYKFLKKA